MKYDLIIIGGGPAGYVGAIHASQLGKKVACIDKERAGGTCLNWGCIPTKSLLRNAELYHLMRHRGEEFGFVVDNLSYDWTKIIGRSRVIANKLAGGIEMLFKKNKIDYILGEATLTDGKTVTVKASDGKETTYSGDKVMIATGVTSRQLPIAPANGTTVLSSRQAMSLATQPETLTVIGAGAIGVEFAYFYNAFGTKVTILEMMPSILPIEDTEIGVALEKSFKKQGIGFVGGAKVENVDVGEKNVKVTYLKDGKSIEITSDTLLVAIGVQALLPAGLTPDLDARGYIKVNENYETNIPGVYAAGDIIGPPWLAHVASFEALQAVKSMFEPDFKPKKMGVFPGCTYCQPQVASVGLTERAAKEQGLKFKVGKFPFMASGKALAVGESEGFVKLIIGEPHGEIIGAHIIGPEATELIAELSLAITLEATHEEIESTIHAHPTLSEAVMEASHAAFGMAIHI